MLRSRILEYAERMEREQHPAVAQKARELAARSAASSTTIAIEFEYMQRVEPLYSLMIAHAVEVKNTSRSRYDAVVELLRQMNSGAIDQEEARGRFVAMRRRSWAPANAANREAVGGYDAGFRSVYFASAARRRQ